MEQYPFNEQLNWIVFFSVEKGHFRQDTTDLQNHQETGESGQESDVHSLLQDKVQRLLNESSRNQAENGKEQKKWVYTQEVLKMWNSLAEVVLDA